MIRDTILWISETLFYLQSGSMLVDTVWFFVWVSFWILVMVFPLFYVVNVRPAKWALLVSMVVVYPALVMAIGPGIVQQQMMQECKTITIENTWVKQDGVPVNMGPLSVNQCRYKDNYYNDFGNWKIVGQTR